ncbi:hypothetical protein L202_08131 [Cryptococcus amylolentus CBS 6039]|uniref:Uncharacterized protein n=2 Tax=Cryptococcus amylolentus TaxID=104669 RepID=A0A1E3H8M6_9TREE|nr:hypothetical protein L202_08131 [Cryptococcus amylolentus CBS 6039]ODN72692.1 hypothetical protein L202_08131 [Cryptococcus amylolentus CBS 6039]ODN97901.1 hypothetical protein I350_07536 [Cryptococcus amylolentus CBS 6273]
MLMQVEDEVGPEKAKKLEETIVILRKTELRYAKRCTWAFCGFFLQLALTIVIAEVDR